ncbi:MAG: OmpA family protein [Flavobacteriales bacterium]
MRNTTTTLACLLAATMLISSCRTSRAVKGGAIGTGAGAGLGAVIGDQVGGKDGTAVGAIIGAVVGGTAGALIGRHMDKQAEELRNDLEGATVTRVGEGIKITFDSGLLFAVDQSELTPTSETNLRELALTLKKYEDTEVLIEGHTDSDGADDHNQELSERRARAVQRFLVAQGLKAGRTTTMGYGEKQPVAENTTTAGKASNRRVEIAIYANDRMKKAADRGEL